MTITLFTEDFFDAAHLLKNYNGKCSKIHGHSWKVEVWVRGEESQKNNLGLLWDFNNLNKIIDQFDHKNLNDIIPENPTVENITEFIYKQLKNDNKELLFKIRVYENIAQRNSYCEIGDF